MRKWIAAALVSASAGGAFAAEPQVSMTIYNSNLALVAVRLPSTENTSVRLL